MGTFGGPNISLDGMVFGYDTGYPMVNNDNSYRFNKGQTTENLIYDMSGTVTSSYPEVVYRCTANETNVVDTSVPGGKYSRFTGIDGSSNNQLYSRFSSYSIDVRGDSVNYSVYLKGSGTCHLTIYDNQSGYGTSSTITLTEEWVRYNYTRTVNASATSYWVAVRGVLNTTDVYVAGQQAMRGTHSTPYVEDNRSSTQSLIDLKETTEIDLTNVSFDSNAQLTFDGTDDYIDIGSDDVLDVGSMTQEVIYQPLGINRRNPIIADNNPTGSDYAHAMWLEHYNDNKLILIFGDGSTHGDVSSTATITDTTKYHHIVCVRDAGAKTVEYFINGVSDGVKDWANKASIGNPVVYDGSTNPLSYDHYIGGHGSFSKSYANIPVVKIYNRTLSTTEIALNFNAYKKRFGL
jgi:hypothetical protein